MNAPLVQQIHVYELAGFLGRLAEATRRATGVGNQWPSVWARSLSLACVECGIQLGSEETVALAQAETQTTPEGAEAKLARLRQGYCARQGCRSHYYTLTLSADPQVDWPAILQSLESPSAALDGRPSELRNSARAWFHLVDSKAFRRVVVGLAVLLMLLVCKYFLSGGAIPGFAHKHKYSVDPASYVHDPGR